MIEHGYRIYTVKDVGSQSDHAVDLALKAFLLWIDTEEDEGFVEVAAWYEPVTQLERVADF